MKRYVFLATFLFVLTAVTPVFAGFLSSKNEISQQETATCFSKKTYAKSSNFFQRSKPTNHEEYFRVLDRATDEILKLPMQEFLIATVATEMSPSFHKEALMAQTVAAFSYFLNVREQNQKLQPKSLRGADFEVNSENREYFMTVEQLKKRWGENFEKNYKIFKKAVEAVFPEILTHSGNYAKTLYHSISSGRTERMIDVFGGEADYMCAVASPWDELAPGYISFKEFFLEEFRTIIGKKWPEIGTEEPKIQERTESGMVKQISMGDSVATGREFREVFALRSANFDMNISDYKVIFTVRGYGHGVGMSQSGAEGMARQGAHWRKILHHYYPWATFEKYKKAP